VRTVLRRAAAVAAVVLLFTGGAVAALTPRLCARPIDVGNAVRDLLEDLDELVEVPARPGGAHPSVVVLALGGTGESGGTGGVGETAEQVRRWLRRLSRADSVRYPFHALLAAYLERLDCNPEAVGVQWFKAAFHARTAAEMNRAGAGLGRAAARLQDPAPFARSLCAAGGRTRRLSVMAAMRRAGLACAPG
jgi:hypothetical protein